MRVQGVEDYLLDMQSYCNRKRYLWDAVYFLNPNTPPRRVEKAGFVWEGAGCVGNGEASTGEGISGTTEGLDKSCSSLKRSPWEEAR